MAPSTSTQPIQEFTLDVALQQLGLSQAQFIDLCIMCGCDYCPNIKGIGPVRALEYIRKHGSLKKVGSWGKGEGGEGGEEYTAWTFGLLTCCENMGYGVVMGGRGGRGEA